MEERPKLSPDVLSSLENFVRASGFDSSGAVITDLDGTEYDVDGKLEALRKHKLLTPERSKAVAKIFADAGKSDSRPFLNHSDMRLKNVIANEEGKILAIIDWEGCTSNLAPAWELSMALHDLGIDEKQQFIEGYGIKPKKLQDIMPLIKAFNIANYATAIDTIAKDKRLLEHYRMRLSGTFDLYSL